MRKFSIAEVMVLTTVISFLAYGLGRNSADPEVHSSSVVLEQGTFSEEGLENDYISSILPEECKLCGREGVRTSVYSGQNNLGIISLNTGQFIEVRINYYDNNGNFLKDSGEGLQTSIFNSGENRFTAVISVNSARGYGTADVRMNSDRSLDEDMLKQTLCQGCLQEIQEKTWGEPYGIGMINFNTGKIRLFTENIRGFLFGDFYVTVVPDIERGESEISELNLQIFFCPERD